MQPQLQSMRLKKDKELKPEPERRMRPHGKQGWALFEQCKCPLTCSICFFQMNHKKLTLDYSLSSSYSMKMENAGFMTSHYWNDLLPVNIKWVVKPENIQALA